MESLLEQQRRLHEEKERLMDSMSRESLANHGSYREKVNSEHRKKQLLDRYMDCAEKLRDVYEDKDNMRREEISALSGPNEFQEFYTKLKAVKDFHRKHPNEVSIPMSVEFDDINKAIDESSGVDEMLVEFTDEEGYGKYLDLHRSHQIYLNLKNVDKIDYITFLTTFDRLFEVPQDKKNSEYRRYLEGLLSYMAEYISRVNPLMDLHDEARKAAEEFELKWITGSFPGWEKESSHSAMSTAGIYLDLSPYSAPEELMPLGLDRLKSALVALSLKCGGTAEQRAHRLFQTKGKKLEEIDASLFAKKVDDRKLFEQKRNKETAAIEAQLYHLVELISEQRSATKENVERKMARGVNEDDELDDEPVDVETVVEDEPDDDIPYNPKNLPLGWDGKPIPYWLYKLHGLNISYPCEICGNQVYKGPKTFQLHFSEWRHSHGMRCLGIPNTAHFANITRIADAIALWQKLRIEKEDEIFRPEYEEEFEDQMGNVITRRMFEDLRRQGIL